MNLVYLIYFALSLLLVGGVFRFVEYKWPDNGLVQALGVIY